MSANIFGDIFRVISFGESHGPATGVVIDGIPPNITLDVESIQKHLNRRRPGQSKWTTSRNEPDTAEVISGLLDGKTTGAPLCLMVKNIDSNSKDYNNNRDTFRPGHGDYSWFKKYGIRDHKGGGRSSGRETLARVAAGAIAMQLLAPLGVTIRGFVSELAGIKTEKVDIDAIDRNPLRCCDNDVVPRMLEAIDAIRADGDSVGAIITVVISNVPAGWGDPVFEKLDALLAGALMGIGGIKGVELGDGFNLASMKGSESNDPMTSDGFTNNSSGGVLGGISTGEDIKIRLAVKPTPSIQKEQQTIDKNGKNALISIKGRHDPCIAPRVVPVAEAMCAIVLVNAWLKHKAICEDPF